MDSSVSPVQVVLTGLVVSLALYMFFICVLANPFPTSIPRVGNEGKSWFRLKTRLAYYSDCSALFREAYEKYSKKGKTCLLPGIGFRQEVILPIGSLRWATTQPENVLSTYEGFIEMDQAAYTACDKNFILNPWQGMLVKRDMNRVLENLAAAFDDELKFACAQRLATNDQSWISVRLYDTMRLIVAQASSRFTVGLPLCRDEAYLKANLGFGDWFVNNAGLISFFPQRLRVVIGPLFGLINQYYKRQITNKIQPEFEERLDLLKNTSSGSDHKQTRDHLQMMMEYAETNVPADLNLQNIAGRLAVANFGSMHQTSLAITNVILNILESDAEYNTISIIRKEVREVLATTGGQWTKSAAAKMMQLDSIMRETLRLHSFGNRSIIRKVVAPGGVKTEDGHHIPNGAMVSILAFPVQTDPELFENALHFDPFRFSRHRQSDDFAGKGPEDTKLQGHDTNSSKPAGEAAAPLSFVSTGPTFLPFGHGKHACPGRFLLDFELKMIIAYLFTNYELELLPECNGIRPKSNWLAEACLPPQEAMIRIKNRKEIV